MIGKKIFSLETFSDKETITIGKKLGRELFLNDIVTFVGDLGAGKTTFIKGIAKSLGIKEEIKSPTFNIVKCYQSLVPLYHIDAYRLDNKKKNNDIGLEEYIEGNGITLIEWPKFIKKLLNKPHLEIRIKYTGLNKRKIFFKISDKYYESKIKKILNK